VSARPVRARLLFLCQTLPFPPDGGVNIRTYNILKILAGGFDIDALFFYRRAERSTADAVAAGLEGLRPFARSAAFPIPQETRRARFVWDHLRSVITREPYTKFAYESNEFEAAMRRLVAGPAFDLVHMDSLDLGGYLPRLHRLRVAVTHHNFESELLKRRSTTVSNPMARRYLAAQGAWLLDMEREWCPRVALNLTTSQTDLEKLRRVAPGGRFEVIPNGVDVDRFRPASVDGQDGLVFVGGTNWFPNRDALDHFCEDILPALRGLGVEVPVRWVGRASPQDRASFAEKYGVELSGYVEDIRPLVGRAACYVVPLRVGGGTRLKILDAWAMGKAVVSTSIGCEGLDAKDGENILIRDDPSEFARAVKGVLDDASLRRRLGQAARRTVEETYSWEVVGRQLLRLYAGIAGPSATRDLRH
jgi:glycosyltransferase involved in cell wall biosynthesis